LGIEIEDEGAIEIASRSRGTPRIANRLLRRARDYADVKADGRISRYVAMEALKMMGVDTYGFDEIDRRLMLTILEKYDGGPVGVGSLSAAISEDESAIEDIYEPYLMQIGFLDRTPRGRMATRKAFEHFHIPLPKGQKNLS
jgi:Holliday junction DNA helicase RuvB